MVILGRAKKCAGNAKRGIGSVFLFLLLAAVALAHPVPEPVVELTAEERAWLDENPDKLTLVFNTEFPPIEFYSDSGTFSGLGADVISLIEQNLGVSFIKKPSNDWNAHLAALKSGACAIAPVIVSTPEREQYAYFTEPYATAPVVIITTAQHAGKSTLESYVGKRLGVVSGYATERYLTDQSALHQFTVVPVMNVTEGLHQVALGQIDAFVENLAVAAYYIDKEGLPNLRVSGKTDYVFAWRIGVSRSYPLLYSAIQKGLNGIPEHELSSIQKKWISLRVESLMNPETVRLIHMAVAFVALLLISLAIMTLLLKRRLNQNMASLRKSELRYRELVENANSIILRLDHEGRIRYFNEYAQRFFGYTADEVLGQPAIGSIVPETESSIQVWQTMVSDIGAHPDLYVMNVSENMLWDKTPVWISWTNKPLYNAAGEITEILCVGNDITERKIAQDALREQEETFRALAENSLDTIMRFDAEGRHLYVNPAVQSQSGMLPEAFIGKTHEELGFPAYLCRLWRDVICEVFDSKQVKRIEFQLPSGIWIDWLVMPEFDVSGNVKAVIASARDITDRKRAEEAITRKEVQYRTLFEAANDAIFLVYEGKFIECNPRTLSLLGVTREQILGMPPTFFSPPQQPDGRDSQQASEALIAKTLQGENQFFEWVHCRYDGTLFDAEVSLTRMELDGKAHVLAIVRDISARKQVEETLLRTQFAMDHSSDSILWVDYEANIIYANDKACSSMGYSREELLAMKVHDIDPDFTPDMWEPHIEALKRAGSIRFESRHRTKDGRIFPVEVTGNYLEFKGRFYSCAYDRDISERKRAEEERAKLQAQLSQAQRMESVGRLAGGVAHDFNNMLNVILGNTELILEQMPEGHPFHTELEEIRKAAERSASLTRQLLAFARKQTVSLKILDLNEVVEGMLKMLRRLIGEDIELIWRPGQELGFVKMDPSQIDQILANLCVNARDAIGDTGTVTIETSAAIFDEAFCAGHMGFFPGDYVVLSVSDNGCGMNQETLDKLFEPFFTTKETGKGTGLGLATVYGIVKQNDGFINVCSEPGLGATFRIYLPRHLADGDSAVSVATVAEMPARGHETILVVEDEPAILQMAATMLQRQGYTVLASTTPMEAIHMAEAWESDIQLLITDVVMPEMNGRVLAERIKALYPSLKCLFMSGYTADVIAHHGVLDEGVHFIQKPFSRKDLFGKVRDTLERG